MPVGHCPNCDKWLDLDGYLLASEPTLFYSECGRIYDMPKEMFKFEEVPIEQLDFSGIEHMLQETTANDEYRDNGFFLRKARWQQP